LASACHLVAAEKDHSMRGHVLLNGFSGFVVGASYLRKTDEGLSYVNRGVWQLIAIFTK
jgi:hypothetical protein